MNMEQQNGGQAKKARKKPVRSRYKFPSYDFGIARQIAEKVEFEGAGKLTEETLAISLHASAKSSGFRLKTLAARQFRLLTKEREVLSTTPLAKAILKPESEGEKRRKMMESFMTVPLFNAVATRFRGQPLPPSQSFRNILEREFGVESNRVNEAERILMDSAREAGLLLESGGKTYLATEMMATTGTPQGAIPPYNQPVAPPTGEVSQPLGGFLTISEQDLAEFNDSEFNDIWQALGKVIRARGRRHSREEQMPSEEKEEEETEEEEK